MPSIYRKKPTLTGLTEDYNLAHRILTDKVRKAHAAEQAAGERFTAFHN